VANATLGKQIVIKDELSRSGLWDPTVGRGAELHPKDKETISCAKLREASLRSFLSPTARNHWRLVVISFLGAHLSLSPFGRACAREKESLSTNKDMTPTPNVGQETLPTVTSLRAMRARVTVGHSVSWEVLEMVSQRRPKDDL